jgi:hypothetical protein
MRVEGKGYGITVLTINEIERGTMTTSASARPEWKPGFR